MYHTERKFFSDEAPSRCGLSPPPPRVPGGFDGIDLNSQASSFPNFEDMNVFRDNIANALVARRL
jgi:hypothetical protein